MNKGVMVNLMTLLCNSINSPGVFFRYPTFCICREYNHRFGPVSGFEDLRIFCMVCPRRGSYRCQSWSLVDSVTD